MAEAIQVRNLPGYEHGAFWQARNGGWALAHPVISIPLVCTDGLTEITEPAGNIYSDVMPFDFVCQKIIAYLTRPATSEIFQIDVKKNGVSVLSTKVTIDAGEKSSVTAATPSVISIANWSAGNEITVQVIDEADGTASGLRVHLIGYYAFPVSADVTAPTASVMSAPSVISDTQINLSWSAAIDNIAVTGYNLQRATDSGFTTGLANIPLGNVTSYNNTGLAADTTYYYRIKAVDAAGNLSAYSNTVNATTDETPFEAWWDSLDPKHTETEDNGLQVTTVGNSADSVKNDIGINSVGDYVEFTYPQGDWDISFGRVLVGCHGGSNPGIWYSTGTDEHLQAFTPAEGDVFKIERISGNNVKIYRNGDLLETTAFGDQNVPYALRVRSYSTVDLNEVFAKPTVTQG